MDISLLVYRYKFLYPIKFGILYNVVSIYLYISLVLRRNRLVKERSYKGKD